MKQQAQLSVSTRSSSINNCDAREKPSRFNDTFLKAVEEALEKEMRKKIEEVMAKLIAQFNSQWDQEDAALKNELAVEKVARK